MTMSPATPIFRPLVADDQDLLWRLMHVSLWDPPPAGLRPIEILDRPDVRIFAEGWGRATDVGVVAMVDGEDAGLCWMRLMAPGVGFAHVDDDTPQLGIALFPPFQHRGVGRPLMQAALDAARRAGYRRVSLTVHPDNSGAIALYTSLGFVKRALRGTYHLMVVSLA